MTIRVPAGHFDAPWKTFIRKREELGTRHPLRHRRAWPTTPGESLTVVGEYAPRRTP